MQNNRAYEKLIGDIQQDLKQLESEIDIIPDINPLNLTLKLLQNSFFNPSQMKELYSRLDKLRAKAQNGLDYYEMASFKPSLEIKADEEIHNNQQISYKQDSSVNQEINTNLKVDTNLETSTNDENCNNKELVTIHEITADTESSVNKEIIINQESSAIRDDYFSQLIDLLANINFLEKRLRKKDTQQLSL